MALIALEEHMIPADLIDRVWPDSQAPDGLRAALTDVGEARLRVMDEAGIDLQVLSVAAIARRAAGPRRGGGRAGPDAERPGGRDGGGSGHWPACPPRTPPRPSRRPGEPSPSSGSVG